MKDISIFKILRQGKSNSVFFKKNFKEKPEETNYSIGQQMVESPIYSPPPTSISILRLSTFFLWELVIGKTIKTMLLHILLHYVLCNEIILTLVESNND